MTVTSAFRERLPGQPGHDGLDAFAPDRQLMAATITILCFIGLLGVFSAVLSALEASVTCLRQHHWEAMAEADESAWVRWIAARLQRQPQAHLLAILIAGALINLGIVVACIYLLKEEFAGLGRHRWLAAAALLSTVILLTDVLPKSIALNAPKQTLRRLALPMRFVHFLFAPLADRLQRGADWLVDRLTPSNLQRRSLLMEDELETWIEMRREIGTLHAAESEIIQEIIRLGDKTAKDCMTPRVDVVVLPDDLDETEARRRILECPHWRIPVYHEELDAIAGILDAKRYLLAGARASYRDFIEAPVFVPETMEAIELFTEWLRAPHSIVIVLDEYGGFEGLVTHTDVVEELMEDAAPPPDHEPEIQNLGHGRLLVTGAARLDEIGPELDLDLEEEGLDTIGGLVFNRLTYLPEPGTKLDLGPATATVRRCSRHRIEEILLERNVGNEPAGDADAGEAEAARLRNAGGEATMKPENRIDRQGSTGGAA